MKTSVKTVLIMSICILFSSFSYGNTPKILKPIEKQKIEFNLLQFCNYLENGNPAQLEGVYASPDKRYLVAIVKNDEKNHDFIGIVIKADNPYWEPGEVRFNFVMKNETLMGYYYNASGDEFPLEFKIDADTLKTNSLNKMDLNQVKSNMIALL